MGGRIHATSMDFSEGSGGQRGHICARGNNTEDLLVKRRHSRVLSINRDSPLLSSFNIVILSKRIAKGDEKRKKRIKRKIHTARRFHREHCLISNIRFALSR